MAAEYKTLGQLNPAITNEEDLYVVPAGGKTICSCLMICNQAATASLVRISVSLLGAITAKKDYILYDHSIAAKAPFEITIGITINETDVIRVYDNTGEVSYNLFGKEIL